MEVGTKVKIVLGNRRIWQRLVGAIGHVVAIYDDAIRVGINSEGLMGYYNFQPEEVVRLEPIKPKPFNAWK